MRWWHLQPSTQTTNQESSLLDLLGGGNDSQAQVSSVPLPASSSDSGGGALLDLLGLDAPTPSTASTGTTVMPSMNGGGDMTAGLMDLLGGGGGGGGGFVPSE